MLINKDFYAIVNENYELKIYVNFPAIVQSFELRLFQPGSLFFPFLGRSYD
jgi:hypothetical protein